MPKPCKSRSQRRKETESGPDDFGTKRDAKRWILDRASPEQYGSTRKVQLENRLLSAGFKGVKVRRVVKGHNGAWTISMSPDEHDATPTYAAVIRRLKGVASDIGFRIRDDGIAALVSKRKIKVSVILHTLNGCS